MSDLAGFGDDGRLPKVIESQIKKMSRRPPGALAPSSGAVELSRYIRPTGLDLDGVSYREWHSIGQTLFFMYEWTPWAIGDWLNYGERVFGETYAQAAAISGRTVRTLYNLSYIARKIPPERRVERLDIGHHDVVAPLPPDEQRRFLDEGRRMDEESNGHLTVPAFREHVRQNRTPQAKAEEVAPPTIKRCEACGGTGEIVVIDGTEYQDE